jgi:hypothetical protein
LAPHRPRARSVQRPNVSNDTSCQHQVCVHKCVCRVECARVCLQWRVLLPNALGG